ARKRTGGGIRSVSGEAMTGCMEGEQEFDLCVERVKYPNQCLFYIFCLLKVLVLSFCSVLFGRLCQIQYIVSIQNESVGTLGRRPPS
ncbi:MAG: hypothetical protein OXG15_00010, partial [Gammaproteobacteria bacterium]|nr:hypothetical protein [Gammaproteobacteria bacterium]